MSSGLDPSRFLPLSAPMFHILMSLSDGERHGYGILRAVEERTEGKLRLGSGTLYPAIRRMLADGLIEELAARLDPEMGGEKRRYYRLTRLGGLVARAEAARLLDLVKQAQAHNLLPEAWGGAP